MGLFGSKKRSGGEGSANDDDGSGFLHPESSLASNRALQEGSEWSKERNSQQMELEDVHDRAHSGCCRRLIEFLVKALHVVDLCSGIALIVYGSLLKTQFSEPAMAAVVFCLIFGTVHFVTSLLGIVSYFRKGLARFGLIVSAYIGPYIALVYLTLIISFAANMEGFLKYLDDHKEVVYLGPNVAQNVKNLMPLIGIILIVLGILEASRWCVLIRLQQRLRRRDGNDPFAPRSGQSTSGAARSSGGNDALTEALLSDNNNDAETVETGGGGAVGKEGTGTPNWWEHN